MSKQNQQANRQAQQSNHPHGPNAHPNQMMMPANMAGAPPGAQQMGNQGQPMMMDPEMIGAIKIKDGLFIGDELASTDLEFVVANKVTHIINCAGKQVQNHWEPIGVAYLTFFWLDQDNQLLLDPRDEAANAIFEFIEEALEATESVLVHSIRGQSRATCALAAYIMRKYKWSLLKALEFLNSRRPDLEIRATFIHQLSAYEARLANQVKLPISTKWDELSNKQPTFACEELLLRNTFINSQMGPITPLEAVKDGNQRKRTIKWIDNDQEKTQGPMLVTSKSGDDLIIKEKDGKIQTVENHKQDASKKSAIKNFKLDINTMTGIPNFDKISKDPLKIPQYAIDIMKAADQSTHQQSQTQSHQQSQQESGSKGGNLFYKNQNPDVQVQESEIEEVSQEVKKPKKNVVQSLEMSDFESEEPKQTSNRPSHSKQTSMISSHSTDEQRKAKRSNNFVNEKRRFKEESSITDMDDPAQKSGLSQQTGGNITNIINNNNINNVIICDPTKVPPGFTQQKNTFISDLHQTSSNQGQNLQKGQRIQSAEQNFNKRDDFKGDQQPQKPGSQQQQRPRKQAQTFRTNSLVHRQQMQNRQQQSQHSESESFPLAMQVSEQSSTHQNDQYMKKPGQGQKPRARTNQGAILQQQQAFNQNFGVSGLMKKEMLRRESPRNRRQLMNNLAMWSQNQSSSQGMAVNGQQRKPTNQQMMMGTQQKHMQMLGQHPSSDLTFFDNKMLQGNTNKLGGTQRTQQNRQMLGSGMQANKFQSHSNIGNQSGPQFFNKTGPIKLSHNSRTGITTNQNMSTNSTTQQVDDILGNGSTDEIILQKSNFNNTQKINNSLSGLNDDDRALQRGTVSQKQSLGSRRELNEKQPLVSGQQLTRPGTAPQQLNAMLGGQNQEKQNRPLSPFDKVYKNQLDKQYAQSFQQQMKSKSKDHAKQKQRQGAILLQNGVGGAAQKKSSSQRPNQGQIFQHQQYAMQGRGFGKPDNAPNFLVNSGGAPQFYQASSTTTGQRGVSPYERATR